MENLIILSFIAIVAAWISLATILVNRFIDHYLGPKHRIMKP